MMAASTRFNHVGPQFAVRDVSRAMAFYQNVLGFGLDYVDGDPAKYAVVFRDEVYIHLSISNHPGFPPGGGRAFAAVSGIEASFQGVGSSNRSSSQGLYEEMGKNYPGFTVPAMNIRGLTYDVCRTIFRKAMEMQAGAFIFEIARSEIGYTKQRPLEYAAVVLAAAVR